MSKELTFIQVSNQEELLGYCCKKKKCCKKYKKQGFYCKKCPKA